MKIIWDGDEYPQITAFEIESIEDWPEIVNALNIHLSWGMVEIKMEGMPTIFFYEFKFDGSFAVSNTKYNRLPTWENIWWIGRDNEGLRKDFEALLNETETA